MRLTQRELRSLIKEAIPRHIVSGVKDASLHGLMEFARRYAALGWAVQEQLNDVVDDPISVSGSRVNPNAVYLVKERLGGLNAELDEVLATYFAEQGLGEED